MTPIAWLQFGAFLVLLIGLARPLGQYMARVYRGERVFTMPVLGPLERLIYRLGGVDPASERNWKGYAADFLLFQLAGLILLGLLLLLQGRLPLNPAGLGNLSWHLAFNTAASFVTNTNWQSYAGESTMSHLSQMLGLTVQNFVSAAGGMAVLVALARGFERREAARIGNFWVDMTRSVVYILLPLSVILTLLLVSQGVVQTFRAEATARVVAPVAGPDGALLDRQRLPLGPVASQVAIKQLGTNGGGYYNVNSAHPFENPSPLSNGFELLAILLIPTALCHTFGRMVGDRRQGRALLAVMLILFVPLVIFCAAAEQGGSPALQKAGLSAAATRLQPGGNMEGKEVRFGIFSSALWAVATTAASNGSVNAMHDSFTPLGGMIPMWLMQLGEVVFGGVGSGLYGLILFAIVAVFTAGLMVGRTPEYMGKKIEAGEMKMASLAILAPSFAVLFGTALAVAVPAGRAGIWNPGAHGFSEVLYAFSSAGNNNGSAFAGLSANTPFYNVALGIAMLIGRYFVAVPVLAIAGSLAAKKAVAAGPGTLPTHTPLFVILVASIVLIVGALTFVPALALGPVADHLQLHP